jgi:hypothetical protein
MLLSYHLSATTAKRRHINPSAPASVLCAAVQPASYRQYLTRAPSRGVTWANGYPRVPAHLMRDGRMRSLYQSISLICTNSPQGTRDHPIQRASCARSAPRRHVLTSTIYAPPHRKHPTLRVLDRSLAHAGCNPEFCRPRTPPPKVHRLLLLTEELLPAPQTAICRSLAELRKRPYGAVRGLMIKVETHAGTVSLLLTFPTN